MSLSSRVPGREDDRRKKETKRTKDGRKKKQETRKKERKKGRKKGGGRDKRERDRTLTLAPTERSPTISKEERDGKKEATKRG